jgi:signal transduction histidine kinase
VKFSILSLLFLIYTTGIKSEWILVENNKYKYNRTDEDIDPAIIATENQTLNLDKYLKFIKDPNHAKNIESLIESKEFSEKVFPIGESPHFGYTSDKIWAYFRIEDQRSNQDSLYLTFNYPLLDFIAIDCFTKNKQKISYRAGDHIPIEEWNQKNRRPSFKLSEDVQECWIGVESDSSMQMPLSLSTQENYNQEFRYDIFIQSLYFGGLITILIYNIFLSFTTKIYTYILYCLFLLSYGLFQASFSGIGYVYLWPNSNPKWVDKTVPFFITLVAIFSYLFAFNILDLKKKNFKIWKVSLGIFYFHLPHLLFLPFVPYKISLFWILGLGVIWTIYLSAISIYLGIKGNKVARFFFIAWNFILFGTLINTLLAVNILNRNMFTVNAQQIGSVIEFTLLSIVLGYKLNLIQKEISKNLEAEVNKRTLELEQQKSEVSDQKVRLERIQSFTGMIQNAPDFDSMSEKIRLTFLENYGLSFYLFYICNTNSKKIELLRIESDLAFPDEIIQELRINSISFTEENSIHIAVMKYGKSIFLKRKVNRGTPSPTEKLNLQLLDMRSLFFIPLISLGKVFAILSFADINPKLQKEQKLHSLSVAQREDIELLCQSIASGLYQSLQKKELESQKKIIENLNIFLKTLNESINLDVVFPQIQKYVNENFQVQHIALGIVDPKEDTARPIYISNPQDKTLREYIYSLKITIKSNLGGHAFAFRTNKPLYIKSISFKRITDEEIKIIKICKFNSVLILPLILNKKNIGFLNLFNEEDKELILTKEQINQLSILAEQLAGIIYSSNLYQELQTQKQHLESTLSELQTTQAQLVEAEKSAALGQLISGVAHEINNPLAAIRSSAEILEMDQSRILEDIPKFFQSASPETLSLFLELQDQSSKNRRYLPSREVRQRKKQIRSTFESIPFESPRVKEDTIEYISELFLEESYPKLNERFTETEALQILQMLSLFSTQKNALKNIRLSTEKSARVIFSLRKFLGTDIKGTPRKIRISDLLETSLRTYDNYIQGIVQVEKELLEDSEIVCVVDEIQQVLKNLIFNAIQSMYASPLKKLGIVVQKVDTEPGEKRKISIEDSGMGVGEDVVQKLFTPFFTTKSRGEGIGLGLYVSKLIVEEHGGRLEYEAVEGGSRFSVWI